MPIYEYKCEVCEEIVEKFQTISIDLSSSLKCIKCNGSVKRVMSLSSFKLVGSGFYVNDYKENNKEEKE